MPGRRRRRQREDGDRRGREPADVLQVVVLEQAGRGDEQVRQQGDDRQHGEAPPVERRRDHVRPLEALGLRQAPGDVDGDDQPDEGDEVDEAPRARRDVGQRQGHHGDPGAEPAGHRQHADGVGPAVAGHLLGGDDGDEEVEGQPERSADGLGGDEDRERRGEGSGGRDQGGGDGHRDHDPTTTDAIGEHGERQDEDDPGPDDGPADADATIADAEVVGGEVDGLGEQRVDERRGHRRRGEQAEHGERSRVEAVRRGPPRGRRGVVVGGVGRRGATAGDRPAHGQGEDPGEPRQRPAIGRRLPPPVTAVVRHPGQRAAVAGERPGGLVERAVVAGPFEDDVVTRPLEDGGHARLIGPLAHDPPMTRLVARRGGGTVAAVTACQHGGSILVDL